MIVHLNPPSPYYVLYDLTFYSWSIDLMDIIQVAVTTSRQDQPVNNVLRSLALKVSERQQRLIPHSIVRCRAVQSELHPDTIIRRWRQTMGQLTNPTKIC